MKTQKTKTITLETKQRKNNTLTDRSAAGTWCQRSRSGRLKTRENPFASWIMPSPVWPPTPTTKCKSSICSHTHNPKTQGFQPQKEKKKGFCSNKRRRNTASQFQRWHYFQNWRNKVLLFSWKTNLQSHCFQMYSSELILATPIPLRSTSDVDV